MDPAEPQIFDWPSREAHDALPNGDGWRVVHMDSSIVVVEKASGLLSVPGVSPNAKDSLLSRMSKDIPGLRIVHRLDRDTSGVMVLARDAESHRILSVAFEKREVSKTYKALVPGRIQKFDWEGEEGSEFFARSLRPCSPLKREALFLPGLVANMVIQYSSNCPMNRLGWISV